MNRTEPLTKTKRLFEISIRSMDKLRVLFAGLLIPFGFAPFHLPGLVILGVALLFSTLHQQNAKQAFLSGLSFGLASFGLGVSWVYVSIHTYGQLSIFLSAFTALLFILYLSIFPALVCLLYRYSIAKIRPFTACLLFSALWCLGEYARSQVFTGFPWLLLGYSQIDTPLKFLAPIIGIYGLSFFCCLSASCLSFAMQTRAKQRIFWFFLFMFLLMGPSVLKQRTWVTVDSKPLSVAVIQANLSMRNKWDESLFWQLLEQYKKDINTLIGKKKIIVLPESALPVPAYYLDEVLNDLDQKAKTSDSAILLGIPQANHSHTYYYNSMLGLGTASGTYLKQHLVPFGEYIPHLFDTLVQWLHIPISNLLKPGDTKQTLITINEHAIASLICYEVAYPELLRRQLPKAEWIVSISDDGWFGHSLAAYQQLQMSQALSLQTGRYQIVSNNDGLSSVIDNHGNVRASLGAFSAGLLEENLYPASGTTPWMYFGDMSIILLCFALFIFVYLTRCSTFLKSNT